MLYGVYKRGINREEQTMRAIAYTRVSTSKQEQDGCSMEMQTEKVRAYCSLNDIDLVAIIEDRGISAKNISGRPGFQEALTRVYAGEADALLVWKLDRAFRSTRDALTVAETLTKKGRALISITEKLDTSTAIGEFFFSLMASLSQMERKLIGERTTAAMQSMKSRGERVGQIPFGYGLSDDGIHLVEDATEQAIIALVQGLKTKGHSYRAIARELNQSGHKTKDGADWTHVQVARMCKAVKHAA